MLYEIDVQPARRHRIRPGDAAEFSQWVDAERGQTTRDAITRILISIPVAALLVHAIIYVAASVNPLAPVEVILN